MIQILLNHGVEVKQEGDKVFAYEAWTKNGVPGGQWVNVTNYSNNRIAKFLNY